MIIRKTTLILGCFVTLFGIGGCMENSGVHNITVNRNITACGIKDPVNKTFWLSEFCKKQTTTDFTGISIAISVYTNKDENHYVISYSNSGLIDYSYEEVYDCSGDKLFFKAIEGPAPAGWNEFFAENKFVATIWELNKE
jgi:hypothetical protein